MEHLLLSLANNSIHTTSFEIDFGKEMMIHSPKLTSEQIDQEEYNENEKELVIYIFFMVLGTV